MTDRRRLAVVPDPKRPYKAGVAFALSLVGAFVTAITQVEVDDLDWKGWLSIAATAILTALGVYEIANPEAIGTTSEDDTIGPPDA